ncbi:alpha/beta fold hydrolase [Luteimonas aquatica]|uniref:alpha/beta fold hydrolase n=1 Tax=Luteimonas aquatica TaxID=450364 RepID=UPI001F58139C|nr:alpha/beta hydrolase [Luteimonas aquatica]
MQDFSLEIPLGRITALRAGTPGAPRVLALHGWLDNAASFVPLAPHLHGIDLVAPDLPGHGGSVHLPRGADYSFAGAMHNVLDIADALGWDRFALLGHSMGAGIASLVAAGSPQRVTRLLAIEALGALPEAPERTVTRLREAVAATRALAGKRLRTFPTLETAVRARMQAGALGVSEAAARLLVERGARAVRSGQAPDGFEWSSDPRMTLPTMVRMTEPQVRNLIAGIECPTRVIYADPPQPYLPEPLRSEHVALLPRGELVVVPGTHHLHMEQPAAVAAAIGDFFVRAASGPDAGACDPPQTVAAGP